MSPHRQHMPGAITRWLLTKRGKPNPGHGFQTSDFLFVIVLAGAVLVFVFQILPRLLGII
jgi:hypothetical protein